MAERSASDHPAVGYAPRDRAWHPPALTPPYKSTRARAPQRPLVALPTTLSELTGPVFGEDLIGPKDHDLLANYREPGADPGRTPIGERILVHGRVMDDAGRPVSGALVEMWQANAGGRYRHVNDSYLAPLDPAFGGCGRALTDAEGGFRFHTVRPGPYPWPNGPNAWRPAHIHFSLFGHGFGERLITQMYFEGDPLIPLCPIVRAIPSAEAIDRLVARLDMEAAVSMDLLAYRFDLVLRGRRQTPFETREEGL